MAARQGDLLGVIIKMPYWSASKVIQPQAFGPLRQYEMQHPKAHRKPATAILAALLLCLSVALAMAGGPLVDGMAVASEMPKPSSGGMDVRERHTAPAIPERSFVVVDWRSVKATALHDDGHSALLPKGIEIPEAIFAKPDHDLVFRLHLRPSGLGYGARAPPAFS